MSLAQDFAVFWQRYPRRVGKLAAQKAYERARKRGATQEQLLEGVAAYLKHKPAYADFCHPATWLNQGRWDDEYETPRATAVATVDWFEECRRLHAGVCNGRVGHANQMHIDAERERRGLPPHPNRVAGMTQQQGRLL